MDNPYHFKGNVVRIFIKEKILFLSTIVKKEDPHNWNIMNGKLNALKKYLTTGPYVV